MMKRTAVFLSCMLLAGLFTGCGAAGEPQDEAAKKVILKYGHYEHINADGSVSTIDLTKDTISFVNHDYSFCHQIRFLQNYSDQKKRMDEEGRKLTEDDVKQIRAEADQYDFKQYEGTSFPYTLSEQTADFVNIYPLAEDGKKVSGLEFTYNEDQTISIGEGYYIYKDDAENGTK